jgi:hypothetical protein
MQLLIVLCLCTIGLHAKYTPLVRQSIPTDICAVTSLADLVEMQTKVDYERIAVRSYNLSLFSVLMFISVRQVSSRDSTVCVTGWRTMSC